MTEIGQEIRDEYEKIKDKISYDKFLEKIKTRMKDYEDVVSWVNWMWLD